MKKQCYYSALQHEHIIWGFKGIDYSLLEDWFKHLKILESNPNYKENIELDAFSYEVMKRRHISCLELTKKLVRRDQIEIVGGSYTAPPMIIIDGESNIRQILLGKRVIKRILGSTVRSFAVQEGGIVSHPQLPQILTKTGYENSILGCFNGYKFASAVGIDGTAIPTVIKSYWDALPHDPKNLQDIIKLCKAGRLVMPMPDWAWGAAQPEWIKEAEKHEEIKNVTASRFFIEEMPKRKLLLSEAKWNKKTQIVDLGAPRISCLLDIANGCEVPKANKNVENLLLTAEKCLSIGYLLGIKPKVRTVENCWKKLFLAQAHDTYFDGSIPELKTWAIDLFKEVGKKAQEVISETLINLTKKINTKLNESQTKLIPIIVLNQLSWKRKEFVELTLNLGRNEAKSLDLLDRDGNRIDYEIESSEKYADGNLKKVNLRFPVKLPPVGYTTYYVEQNSKEKMRESVEVKKQKTKCIKNKHLKVTCNARGEVTIFEKATGRQVLKGNFLTLKDQEGYDDSRLYPVEIDISKGSLTSHIIVKGKLRKVYYTTKVTVADDSRRVDFETELRVQNAVIGEKVTWWCMIPETALANNFIFNINNGKITCDYSFGYGSQNSRMLFPLNWIDYSNEKRGISIFHNGTHGFWIKESAPQNLMNLWLWSRLIFDENFRNSHMLPITRNFQYRYAIFLHGPHESKSQIVKKALEYANPPVVFVSQLHEGTLPNEKSLISVDKNGVILSALAPNSRGLLARFYELNGRKTRFKMRIGLSSVKRACMATLDGKRKKALQIRKDNTIYVNIKPHEIISIVLVI
jgi:alpha-mannosidase